MKQTLLIGLGISGKAAARLLVSMGKNVVAIDKNAEKLRKEFDLQVISESEPIDFDQVEMLVLSSGIRSTHPLVKKALDLGIEVVGEAELALRHLNQKCLAITGTNGKTTVTLLVEHILKSSGIKARAVGNIGIPLCDCKPSDEVLVVELSSYQLETFRTPLFSAGIVLNITPDHLDQYSNMEEYVQAKCALQRCVRKGGAFFIQNLAAKTYGHFLQAGYLLFDQEDKSCVKQEGSVAYFLPLSYRELGRHETENALAAWALVKDLGVTSEQFLKALESFKKPPHRIEFVREIDGVVYYDDSKGTNLDAVIQAVGAMKGKVILIAGGVDKGTGYAEWKGPFKDKVKQIIAIGQAAPLMQAELGKDLKIELSSTLEKAVERAQNEAKKGECVLLSPGCASFDMFRDYAHRGEEFKRFVHNLRSKS